MAIIPAITVLRMRKSRLRTFTISPGDLASFTKTIKGQATVGRCEKYNLIAVVSGMLGPILVTAQGLSAAD